MKLTTDEKRQIFFDSFEMFKDDWEKNAKTLTRVIAEVAKFDIDSAIQMWIYVLEKNQRRIKTNDDITSGVFGNLNEDAYGIVAKNSFIKEAIFLKSSCPWESIDLITYFVKKSDYYQANELYELIARNKNKSEFNFSEYISSNISTCLFYTIDELYRLGEEDIDFLSDWIERVDDVNERMKLKVLLLSKEKITEPSRGYNSFEAENKNDYLLEGASLEDLELASSDRERFEIKKLVESVCKRSVSEIEFSKLDISWLNRAFENSLAYSNTDFNIIGAYYALSEMSYDTQRLIREIYEDKVEIESLWKNSYTTDTEFTIKQKLGLIQKSFDEMAHRWSFSRIHNFSNSIITLNNAFLEYISVLNDTRTRELLEYKDISIDNISLTTRVRNILIQNDIRDIPSLVKQADYGISIEGLGEKSITEIYDKISRYGITINLYSVKDDLDFIMNYFHIKTNNNYNQEAIFDATRLLGMDRKMRTHGVSRSQLLDYLEEQKKIAEYFIKTGTKKDSMVENMLMLRKNDNTIYLPGKYFFMCLGTDLYEVC